MDGARSMLALGRLGELQADTWNKLAVVLPIPICDLGGMPKDGCSIQLVLSLRAYDLVAALALVRPRQTKRHAARKLGEAAARGAGAGWLAGSAAATCAHPWADRVPVLCRRQRGASPPPRRGWKLGSMPTAP